MPPKRRFLIRILVLVPLIVLLALAVLVSREWEAPELGRTILARQAELRGVELDVANVRFHVLQGIRLNGVRARLASPGGQMAAEMEVLELEHRLGPLLAGRIEVDELRLVRPVVHLLLPDEPAPAPPPGGAAGASAAPLAGGEAPGDVVIAITRIVVKDGSFVVESAEEGATASRLEGVDLTLRDLALDAGAPSALLGLTATGELDADAVEADPLVGRDLGSDLTIAGGKVTLDGLELEAEQGPVDAEALVLDLATEPWVFEVRQGSVVPVALADILGSTGESFGRAELAVAFTGNAETLGLDGGGRVAVGEGTLPSIPLLEALERLVGTTAISGSPYESFELPFRLSGTRIDLEPTEIRTPDLGIGIAGAADLAGSVDLRATLRFPREGFDVEEIPTEVLDLLTDAEGFVNLHAGLVGPLEAPRATLDRSGWQATAREAVERELRRGLEEEAGKLLRGLLGGDDEEDGGG